MRIGLIILWIIFSATNAYAKEIAITCTLERYTQTNSGYHDTTGDFSVLITENTDGIAIGASVSFTPICEYTEITTYNTELIHLSGCAGKTEWSPKDWQGSLKINRYTGKFIQSAFGPTAKDFIVFSGTCRAGSRKF